jgi:hypothetical protein
MSETAALKAEIAELRAEVAALKAQLAPPPQPRASNIVEERRVTITPAPPPRGTLPSESEVDQLLALVERDGHVPKFSSASDRLEFRGSFVAAIQFLGSVGRLDNAVNQKISGREWALHGERYMGELGRSVNLTNGAFWAAAIACGVPHVLGHQMRGLPARLGLALDSSLPRANSRWREILRWGKTLPPIAPPDASVEAERRAPVTIRLDPSPSGMT